MTLAEQLFKAYRTLDKMRDCRDTHPRFLERVNQRIDKLRRERERSKNTTN